MGYGTGVPRRSDCVIAILLVWATGTWSMQIRVALYDIRVLSTGVINHKESSLKLHQAITPSAQTWLHHPMRSRRTACDDRRIKSVTS
jgi:hypothetical protein